MRDSFFLSESGSLPMYSQIVAQVTAKVMAGDWQAGQPLPSIRELASANRVSVITVKRAYLELEHAGIIVTRQGKGSFVADTLDLAKRLAQEEFQTQLKNTLAAAAKLGMRPVEIISACQAALADPTRTNATHPSTKSDQPQ